MLTLSHLSRTSVEKEALDVLQKVMKYNIHKIGRVIVTSNEVRCFFLSSSSFSSVLNAS